MDLTNLSDETTPLIITDEIHSFLFETAKWAKFLSIVGFVFTGLMVLMGLFFGSVMSYMSDLPQNSELNASFTSYWGFGMSFFYVLMAIIYFFPIYYLYQFSNKMKIALKEDDQYTLSSSFSYLKSHYKFFGILMIIVIGVYICIFLFSGVALMFLRS